ncbi:MAG: right-handed parallel beta-helix repeat-containing protein [Candidatus Kariarchaeaceae archaeon]|jgi:hypothetical protein
MADSTNYYVDPSTGDDGTGDGTSGTPWKTVQKALDTITKDTTNGDRINISHSATDTLGAQLDFTTYGFGSIGAPLVFQGWVNGSQGNGALRSGMGRISGSGTYSVIGEGSTGDYFIFNDMMFDDSGSNQIINGDDFIVVSNCHFENASNTLLNIGGAGTVLNSSFKRTDGGTTGNVVDIDNVLFFNNYIEANGGVTALVCAVTTESNILSNIINISRIAQHGIILRRAAHCIGNTIYNSTAGTGAGIFVQDRDWITIVNNYVEGFSGAGGDAWDITGEIEVWGYNKWNNCTNHADPTARVDLGNTGEITPSPLADPGSGDFTVGTALKGAGWPSLFPFVASTPQAWDIGAAQRVEAAAGLAKLLGTGGGLVG